MKRAIILLFVFLLAGAPYASADDDDAITADKYFYDASDICPNSKIPPMTGKWGDARSEIAAKGVTFESSFVADTLGNVSGGMHQGARWNSSTGWDINFDLEKAVGMIGTQFHISGLWRAGQNLSSTLIGNAFVASSIYGSQQFRLYGLYIEKTFLDKKLNIRAGRIATGDDFAASDIYWNFVTNSIDGNPIAVPINVFFPTYPTAVWGVRAKCDIAKDVYAISGLYNGDPRVGRMEACGLDFSMRLKQGIIFAQELAYAPNANSTDTGYKLNTLPGRYKAGFYYHGGTFRDYYSDVNGSSAAITGLPAKKHIGNYGLYFHADQMIYRKPGTKCNEGITPFVVVTLAPDSINKFPFFIDGGFVWKGSVPTRKHDVLAIGFAYGKYSSDLAHYERDNQEVNGSATPIQSYELAFDFSYKVQITPWMFLQPDMQYIVNPSGGHNIDNAVVVGTRFGLTF